MTTPITPTAARPPEPGAGEAILAAAGTAVRKGTASAAKGVLDAIATAAGDELGRAITGSARKTTSTKKKSTTTKKTTSKAAATSKGYATKPGEFDFLKDKSLSPEERLFRLMALMAKKYDDALDKKLAEIQKKTEQKKAEAAKKDGGLLGGVLGALGKVTPLGGIAKAVGTVLGDETLGALAKQLSGPVLAAGAAALGVPQLAPILLQAGPSIAAALPGVVNALAGEAAPAASSASGKGKAGEPELDPMDQMELQRLMEKQKQMFGTISNVLRAMHDTKMSIIGNIR